MGYEAQHNTASDPGFQNRITMCVAEQAEIFLNDERPEYKNLAIQAIAALEPTAAQFVPLVAVRPAITTVSNDEEILAAVQYVWPLVGARYVPITAPAPPPLTSGT